MGGRKFIINRTPWINIYLNIIYWIANQSLSGPEHFYNLSRASMLEAMKLISVTLKYWYLVPTYQSPYCTKRDDYTHSTSIFIFTSSTQVDSTDMLMPKLRTSKACFLPLLPQNARLLFNDLDWGREKNKKNKSSNKHSGFF